ncbi:type II secretion system F family protein [Spongisporangium articulatum]|uniref:Type II secretion system F family protein n=1 Tax=Spongisporangium articulatum TaxID=3362603 RepID=A0ABW8AKQ7_9ACTN
MGPLPVEAAAGATLAPLAETAGFALAGALVVGGVLLLVSALRRRPENASGAGPSGTGAAEPGRTTSAWFAPLLRHRRRVGVAAGAALLTLVVTRWPVAAVAAGALTLAWPSLLGGGRAERRAAARLEALAIWTESLRDTIAGAVGLEQAIIATARSAPAPIAPQLRLLADRLRVRVPLETALRRLAEDLDDTSADLIVAALILNSRLRGPGLRQVLTSLSESARAELEMRGRVSAGRAATRRSVQIVVGVTVLFVLLLVLGNPGYVEPYRHPAGQLVLAIVVAFFGAGFFWLRRLSEYDLPARFLGQERAVEGVR